MSERLVIGVDLGGTRIRAALSDLQGRFRCRLERPTGAEGGWNAVVERLVELIQEVQGDLPAEALLGVGVGTPGPLDHDAGVVFAAPNIPGDREMPLRSILERRLELPVRMANDGNIAVLGEWLYGAGRGRQNLVYVTISTGIGGGIVADGHLLLGHRGLAGEIGHMTLQEDGPRCNCGNQGCWEALASGTAIAREGAAVVRAGRSDLLAELCGGQPSRLDAAMVGRAALQGDPAAAAIIERAARISGIGVATLLHLYSPELVLIGGGVAALGPYVLEPLRREARRRAMPPYREVPIEPASLGDDTGLLGAVGLYRMEA